MEDKKTIEKEFTVFSIMKRPVNIGGTDRDKWEIAEPEDDEGNNRVHDLWSATLAEGIKAGDTYNFKIEQGKNKGGYDFSKVVNVAKPGEPFKERESQGRFKKNYDALNRKSAVEVAATLINLKYAPVSSVFDVAEEVRSYIESGLSAKKETKKEDVPFK